MRDYVEIDFPYRPNDTDRSDPAYLEPLDGPDDLKKDDWMYRCVFYLPLNLIELWRLVDQKGFMFLIHMIIYDAFYNNFIPKIKGLAFIPMG